MFKEILDSQIKRGKVKITNQPPPWIDTEIRKDMNQIKGTSI